MSTASDATVTGAPAAPSQEQAERDEAQRVAQLTDVAPADAQDEDARGAASKAQEPASFEDQVKKLERVVLRQPLHREIAYKILEFCQERHLLAEIEQAVQEMPEYRFATMDPYHQLTRLEDAGGVERFPLDAQGEIVAPAQLEGLSEDEADDLVRDYAFQTTDVGEEVIARGTPESRMEGLFEAEPDRRDTYVELLSFFDAEPRSYQDVCDLLAGRDVLQRPLAEGGFERIQPSVFVDRLERAGAIVWDGGWNITDEGRRCLGELAS